MIVNPPVIMREKEIVRKTARVSYPEFAYEKGRFKAVVAAEELRETERYLNFDIKIITEDQTLNARYFKNKSAGKKRLVIVLPIYDSSKFPPEMIAMGLTEWSAAEDTNVVLIHNHNKIIDWGNVAVAKNEHELETEIERSVKNTIQAIRGIRRLMDWAETQEEVDSKRIGMVGFSIGAIMAGIAMGVDERISAGVLVTAGGNPEDIFADSEAKFIKKSRDKLLKTLGWTKSKLREKISPKVGIINPVRYAGNIDPRRILWLEAEFDEYIPQSSRNAFWEALGRPERIIFQHGHTATYLFSMTILGFHYTDRAITKFFNEKL